MAAKIVDTCGECGAPIYLGRPCEKGHSVTPAQDKKLSDMKDARKQDKVERKLDGEDVDTTSGRHKAACAGENKNEESN